MQEAYSCFSGSETDTVMLGCRLAQIAEKGDIFALFGTLGMGKSVLSRAFIQSFVGETDVPSPTFTLLQTYETPKYEIYHFDLYRLKNADEIFELGMEEAMFNGVCLIEWPEKMGGYLPKRAIRVELKPEKNGRRISFLTADEARFKRLQSLSGLE